MTSMQILVGLLVEKVKFLGRLCFAQLRLQGLLLIVLLLKGLHRLPLPVIRAIVTSAPKLFDVERGTTRAEPKEWGDVTQDTYHVVLKAEPGVSRALVLHTPTKQTFFVHYVPAAYCRAGAKF